MRPLRHFIQGHFLKAFGPSALSGCPVRSVPPARIVLPTDGERWKKAFGFKDLKQIPLYEGKCQKPRADQKSLRGF